MHLSWLVLVHLCCVFLVILVFKGIFVCFQILRTMYARRCILEPFGAKLGLEWLVHVWSKRNGRS